MERKLGFFRWFRTLPLLAVALTGLLCLGISFAPHYLLRRFVFPVSHRAEIVESASRHGIDTRLVCAVISCESGWKENAQSGVGAIGLMQVMPTTAETLANFGYVDPYYYDMNNLADPAANIEYGCACLNYLDDNLESQDQVIAAYNAGLGSLQSWMIDGGGSVSEVIAYPETKIYLIRVTETYKAYQQLYDAELNEI